MNEFIIALVALAASLQASAVDNNDGIMVTFSVDNVGASLPEMVLVSGTHTMLGVALPYDTDRHRCQITTMDPGTPAH
jgi:hypothetical protein